MYQMCYQGDLKTEIVVFYHTEVASSESLERRHRRNHFDCTRVRQLLSS